MTRASLLVAALAACAACATRPADAPRPEPARYDDPRAWLCLPGRDDACAADLAATELRPDGTRAIERFAPARDPKVDCFYVYPTVDFSLVPGNHATFDDLAPMTAASVAQAARFRATCALYVPLYRQATLGSYLRKSEIDERLAFAYDDVRAAFRAFLARADPHRPMVLLGHSQGAEMVTRLLREFFDGEQHLDMRMRLLVALPIGGELEAQRGSTGGGTFATIPACTSDDEVACVLAYRTHAAGAPLAIPERSLPREGDETICTNPADLAGNALRPLSAAYLPVTDRTRRHLRGAEGVTTPFVVLRDFYAARCEDGPRGYRYLAVSLVNAPGDARANALDFARMPLAKQLGLHLVDFQLPQGELLDQVAKRARAVR